MTNTNRIKIDNNILKNINIEIDSDNILLKEIINDDNFISNKWRIAKGFKPIYDKNSKILIVGTIPSKKGRKNKFYYSNKENNFWELLSNALSESNKKVKFNINNYDSIKRKLKENNIALADTIDTCIRVSGSLDDGIVAYKLNDEIKNIIRKSEINKIVCTSETSKRFIKEILKITRINKKHTYKFDDREIQIEHVTSPSATYWKNITKKRKEKIYLEWKNALK